MKRLFWIVLPLLTSIFILGCANVGALKHLPDRIRLLNFETQQLARSSSLLSSGRPSVWIIAHPDCPIVQKYTKNLNEFQAVFPQVDFYSIMTRWTDEAEVRIFRDSFQFQLPIYQDTRHKLIHRLHATTTPEVFLWDKNGQLVYRGAIDNWFFSLGRYRPAATERYLEDAIKAVLAEQQAPVTATQPIGGLIGK